MGLLISVALGGALLAVASSSFAGCVEQVTDGEAELSLNVIEQANLRQFREQGRYVESTQGATPAQSCCAQNIGGQKACAVVAADWSSSPTWTTLGFTQSESFHFQYNYTGVQGGQGFIVEAIGDLDCDGTSVSYRLVGNVSGGEPAMVIIKPTSSD